MSAAGYISSTVIDLGHEAKKMIKGYDADYNSDLIRNRKYSAHRKYTISCHILCAYDNIFLQTTEMRFERSNPYTSLSYEAKTLTVHANAGRTNRIFRMCSKILCRA